MKVHDIGDFYWGVMVASVCGPLATRDFTHEIVPPYRIGRSLLLRFPLTGTCLVLGRWFAVLDEPDALFAATQAREVPLEEIQEASRR